MVSRLRYYGFWLHLAAYSLPVWAFAIAFYLRFHTLLWRPGTYKFADYVYLLVLTMAAWAWFADRYKISSVENLLWERTGIRAAIASCAWTYVVESAVLFFVRLAGLSRAFVVLHIVLLLFLTLVMRFLFRKVVGYHHNQQKPLRIILIGTDQFASRVARRLSRTRLTNCLIAGYVRLPDHPVVVKDAPVHRLEDIEHINVSDVDDIVVAVPLSQYSEITGSMRRLQRLSKPIRAVMEFGGGVSIREKLFQFGDMQMMDLATTPAESLQYLLLKRGFDIAFSSIVLLLLSPLLGIVALAVKLSSPGPVFFRQERVGLNGQVFQMHKFRTMRVAPSAESDTKWTTASDPRRTTVGALLRRTSLDELPQFLDVLRGDMSVVGPRPERPYFVGKFLKDMQRYSDRHLLKVGITGWAQVNGWRGDTSISKRIEYDRYYLQNWSLGFDLQIIVRTIWCGLINRNAY